MMRWKSMSKKISKKALNKVIWRNMFALQWSWNYETMQGSGYGWCTIPALKELYDDPEDLKKMLKIESTYFNTTPAMAHLIMGADLAMQEQFGTASEETITGIKTGLMGPFAGIGDTIFLTIYRAVFFSIASYIALNGSAVGLLVPLVMGLIIIYVRYRFTLLGYYKGQQLAQSFGDTVSKITECASVLGLTVVGGLIPSVFSYSTDLVFTLGEKEFVVQDYLNMIVPSLIPLLIVFLSYWLLGKKWMNSTKLIFVLLLIGLVLGNLNLIFPGA